MARKSRNDANRIIRKFRRRAIVFLRAKGHEFKNEPSNLDLFSLLGPHFPECSGMPKAEKVLSLIKLLDVREELKGQRLTGVKRKARTEFYQSREWMELRYAALKANDGRCELCGASKHDGAVLHVDHILPRSKFPKLELDAGNLQVLCEACNLGKSNKDMTDWRLCPSQTG